MKASVADGLRLASRTVSVAGRDWSAIAAAIASLDPAALALQGKVLVTSKVIAHTRRLKRPGRIAVLLLPAAPDASIQFTDNSLGHPAHLKCRPRGRHFARTGLVH